MTHDLFSYCECFPKKDHACFFSAKTKYTPVTLAAGGLRQANLWDDYNYYECVCIGRIATIGVLVSAFMTFPTFAAPVIRILSEILLGGRQTPAQHDTTAVVLKVLLMVVTAWLAMSVPSFGFIAGLMGSVVDMLLVLILPPAFFVSVHWQTLPAWKKGFGACVIVAGCVAMVVSVQSTLATI